MLLWFLPATLSSSNSSKINEEIAGIFLNDRFAIMCRALNNKGMVCNAKCTVENVLKAKTEEFHMIINSKHLEFLQLNPDKL